MVYPDSKRQGPHVASPFQQEIYERPKGIYGVYAHPVTQVILLGLVCFLCSGLFNAMNGLGAGCQVDSATSSNSNSAVYATFAISAFFSGFVNNKIGSRMTLFLGSLGYGLYFASYLTVNILPDAGEFVIVTGAILGICAGLLWTAQGSLILSYPTENQKGRFISIFWLIFNMGAVIGSAISLAINFNSSDNSVGNGTYIAFLVLTLFGSLIPMIMVNPQNVIRTDGTKVTAACHLSWKVEIYGLWMAVRDDPLIVLLFPMFFASNWFYTWQFNAYNSYLFNIQARSLNNLLYWIAQIIGSAFIGFLLDHKAIGRRTRAFVSWGVLFAVTFAVHTWAYFYQKDYTRTSIPEGAPRMGIHDPGYVARIWLYVFCGILDAMWQITVYWIMGALSNDPAKLAYFTGLYKSLQSVGAAVIWRADGQKIPYENMFVSTWVILVAGLLFALPMIYLRVKDTTGLEDETSVHKDC